MAALPSGTVAFLFTDVEGSTRLWQHHRAAMERAYARHDAVLRGAVADQGGVVYKVVGDAVQAAFPTAEQAVTAALEIQLGLDMEDWAGTGLPKPLRVRAALHAGAVDPDPDGDYRSPVLNRLGRLLGAGHGGQILLSQAVAQLARDRLPEETTLRDLGEHRLKDLLEPERVWQLLHPALPADFPDLATLDVRPHNLPVQLTPVIGREKEVWELTALLRRPDVRLVTLTGPGGTGKTRLALQAAAELVDDYPDGVWFVPLAAITDPALVPSAIAGVLGVRESGATPLPELLRAHLADERLLLVLDNFEQVLDAAPVVGALLAAPGVRVLVTSRAGLRLRGEREVPVPPLALPNRRPPPTAEQLGLFGAVRLFLERAQGVRPDFAATNETAPAIAEICHRLDGLPLAIELAAARVKLLSPPAMLARLEQRLPLLTGGARDLPARQQTLRATIAWSYDLLEPDEQKLYRRLSVFAGGWTLEAAEAVAGSQGSGELGLDVLEGLGRLVDHSLGRQVEGTGGGDRFAMLETIREYGLEQLEAEGEADAARRRHAAHFLEAGEAELATRGTIAETKADARAARFDLEHDNLRAALAWALAHEPPTAARLAATVQLFWLHRYHVAEGLSWLERVLAHREDVVPATLARLLNGVADLAGQRGDYTRSAAAGEEALVLARSVGDGRLTAWALSSLAFLAMVADDLERAAVLVEEAIGLARQSGDREFEGVLLPNAALLAVRCGRYAAARTHYEDTRRLGEALGSQRLTAAALQGLGWVATKQREDVRGAALTRQALGVARAIDERFIAADCLDSLATIAGRHGRTSAAGRLAGAAAAHREALDYVPDPASQRELDDQAAAFRLELGDGAYAAAWEAGRALSLDEAVAEGLALADALADDGTEPA